MRPQAVDEDLFDRLAATDGRDLVSIFIPTHVRGRQVNQDPIRLKNELSRVDDELERRGWSRHDREGRLGGCRGLLDDREFWEHQKEGLAVYVDETGDLETVAMSEAPAPQSMVLSVFQLRPLLPDLDPLAALIMVLTRGEVSLFAANGSSVRRMDADLPESVEDVNWFVDRERQRQQHPDRVGTQRSRHGHEPALQEHEDLNRFLRAVADAIDGLSLQDRPLIVLGDDDLVARFEAVHGNTVIRQRDGGLSGGDLVAEVERRASDLLARLAVEREAAWVDEALAAIGTGRAETDIGEALPAAVAGRVGTVVLHDRAEPIWGRLEEGSMEVEAHEEARIGDVDLLDRLAVMARARGADIHSVSSEQAGGQFVAILRY